MEGGGGWREVERRERMESGDKKRQEGEEG